jgi:hypothetical protein
MVFLYGALLLLFSNKFTLRWLNFQTNELVNYNIINSHGGNYVFKLRNALIC